MGLKELIGRARDAVREARERTALVEACGQLRTSGENLSYSDAAIAAFEAIHVGHPQNPAILHHLAIAYHARAWDLELRGHPSAIDSWVRGLACWNALAKIDAFWDLLRARLVAAHPHSDPDLVTEVRRGLPQDLIDVHHRFIWYHWQTGSVARSRAHKEAVEHGLPDAVGLLEQTVLQTVVRDVAAAVGAADYPAALTMLDRVLDLYPDNLQALTEYMRVCAAWFEELKARAGYETALSLHRRAQPRAFRLARLIQRSATGAAGVSRADVVAVAEHVQVWAVHRTEDLFAASPPRAPTDRDVAALEAGVWWGRLAWRGSLEDAAIRFLFAKCVVHHGHAVDRRHSASSVLTAFDVNSVLVRLLRRHAKYLCQALRALPADVAGADPAAHAREICRLDLEATRTGLRVLRSKP